MLTIDMVTEIVGMGLTVGIKSDTAALTFQPGKTEMRIFHQCEIETIILHDTEPDTIRDAIADFKKLSGLNDNG